MVTTRAANMRVVWKITIPSHPLYYKHIKSLGTTPTIYAFREMIKNMYEKVCSNQITFDPINNYLINTTVVNPINIIIVFINGSLVELNNKI